MTSSNYNPEIHHRRSIRLKGYDYSSQGAYFVTLCCENRQHRFGEISESQMELTPCGQIATEGMENLPTKFPAIEIGEYIIMPDHIHAIISIRTGNPRGCPNNNGSSNDSNTSTTSDCPEENSPTIGQIIGAYTSLVANDCLKWHKEHNLQMGKFWQRNYYEHIIRDEQAYENISNYIRTNPERWQSNRSTGNPRGCPKISNPRGCPDNNDNKDGFNIGDRKGRHNDDNNHSNIGDRKGRLNDNNPNDKHNK